MTTIGTCLHLLRGSVCLHGIVDWAKELTLTILLLGTVYYDLRFRIVPNPLIAVSIIVGLVLRAAQGVGSLIHTVLLTLMIGWPFYLGFRRGWMGGGDVKLVAAASLLAGEEKTGAFFLAGTAAGGLASLLSIVSRKRRERLVGRSWTRESAERPLPMVPYAAAYSLGILVFRIMELIAGKG
ncbi:MAG: prepilin peptidase [Firmicutes bacterium]|nr:prepilin peptidase [Bacillota bacterium]